MIQRVQTIYMLASVIAILTMHFFWLASFSIPEATIELTSLGLSSTTQGFALDVMGWDIFLLLIIMLALPLVTIFLYKQRKLQWKLLIYAAVLNGLYYALFFFDCYRFEGMVAAQSATVDVTVGVHYNYIMLVMPALSIFCLIMAMRGVIYDIALLKGLDRLR